ncbi:hypothetical protein NDA01_28070 [Trichocoleus desertorum AS-A10]|uniref:hypothetical protein n=1 Tax=Trichocoleus desertorum TaxID=1481672 RepID=UPI0032994FC8
MSQRKQCRPFSKNDMLSFVVIGLGSGLFALACVDKDIRHTFADLAKVGVGSYITLTLSFKSDRKGTRQTREPLDRISNKRLR